MSHFFAYLSRMKHIRRWGLMHCAQPENVQEHSLQVAIIAHALAVIKNKFFGGKVNEEKVALYAIFHDATEVITADLPTPVKYHNSEISSAYKAIEEHAGENLLKLLPADFHKPYKDLILTRADNEIITLIKSADTLSAYIKCLEEESHGNPEFNRARKAIGEKLANISAPEVSYFIKHFLSSYAMTLDEISAPLEL